MTDRETLRNDIDEIAHGSFYAKGLAAAGVRERFDKMLAANERLQDRCDVLRGERDQLRDQLEALCDAAEARGAASLPAGMTLSGFAPLASAILPARIRAILAHSGGTS